MIVHDEEEEVNEAEGVDVDKVDSSDGSGSEFALAYVGSPIELIVMAGREDGNPGGGGPGGYTPGKPIPKRPNPVSTFVGQNYSASSAYLCGTWSLGISTYPTMRTTSDWN